jgi:hypothetical protein
MEIKDFGSHNLNTTGGKVPDTVYFYNKQYRANISR